jgi:hypothetical protein
VQAAVQGVELAESVALQAEKEVKETVERTRRTLAAAQEALKTATLAYEAVLQVAPLALEAAGHTRAAAVLCRTQLDGHVRRAELENRGVQPAILALDRHLLGEILQRLERNGGRAEVARCCCVAAAWREAGVAVLTAADGVNVYGLQTVATLCVPDAGCASPILNPIYPWATMLYLRVGNP